MECERLPVRVLAGWSMIGGGGPMTYDALPPADRRWLTLRAAG